MDQDFCKLIDQDDLIEKHIEGKLHGELLNKFTEHLSECEEHARAVTLEKALQRGVRDFARSELKSNLRHHIKKQEISKYYILRYAAVLIVAIMAPIILYYQYVAEPDKSQFAQETLRSLPVEEEKIEAPEPDRKMTEPTPSLEKESIVSAPVADQKLTVKSSDLQSEAVLSSSEPPKSAARQKEFTRMAAQDMALDFVITPSALGLQDSILIYIKNQEIYLKDCFSNNYELDGKELQIQFDLDVDGMVSKITLNSPDLLPPDSKECIVKKIQSWNPPRPEQKIQIKKRIDLITPK